MQETIRRQQEADPVFGRFFEVLYEFAARTKSEFFFDAPEMPMPIITTEKDGSRRGSYRNKDGALLPHCINLNVYVLRDGEDAAETLAHEMVHLFQDHVGRPSERNYHSEEFHARMAEYGIRTEGVTGRHVGYTSGRWQAWLVENEDLRLEQYKLPGMDRRASRKVQKWACPTCGVSVRSRRRLNLLCIDCDVKLEVSSGSDS